MFSSLTAERYSEAASKVIDAAATLLNTRYLSGVAIAIAIEYKVLRTSVVDIAEAGVDLRTNRSQTPLYNV